MSERTAKPIASSNSSMMIGLLQSGTGNGRGICLPIVSSGLLACPPATCDARAVMCERKPAAPGVDAAVAMLATPLVRSCARADACVECRPFRGDNEPPLSVAAWERAAGAGAAEDAPLVGPDTAAAVAISEPLPPDDGGPPPPAPPPDVPPPPVLPPPPDAPPPPVLPRPSPCPPSGLAGALPSVGAFAGKLGVVTPTSGVDTVTPGVETFTSGVVTLTPGSDTPTLGTVTPTLGTVTPILGSDKPVDEVPEEPDRPGREMLMRGPPPADATPIADEPITRALGALWALAASAVHSGAPTTMSNMAAAIPARRDRQAAIISCAQLGGEHSHAGLGQTYGRAAGANAQLHCVHHVGHQGEPAAAVSPESGNRGIPGEGAVVANGKRQTVTVGAHAQMYMSMRIGATVPDRVGYGLVDRKRELVAAIDVQAKRRGGLVRVFPCQAELCGLSRQAQLADHQGCVLVDRRTHVNQPQRAPREPPRAFDAKRSSCRPPRSQRFAAPVCSPRRRQPLVSPRPAPAAA